VARMRVASVLAAMVGALTLLTAFAGSMAGLGSYGLYEANLISVDTGANLILVSVRCSLIVLPIGFVGWRWAERRGQEATLSRVAMALAAGTLGVWIVVVTVALGK
jgi:hypothetical protein